VKNKGMAVAARLDIELDTVTLANCCGKGGAAILDSPAAMEPAMRERRGGQPSDALAPGAWSSGFNRP
jgi:hypothetical protein